MSRIRLLLACVTASLLASIPNSSATAVASAVVLDGVKVALATGTHQVITVRRTSGTYARVTMWIQTDPNHWAINLRSSSGRIGSGGLVAGDLRQQGTNTTPTGTYPIPFGFGVDTVPGATYPYRRVTTADWWVEDNDSVYYNRWRDSTSGFRWWLGPLRLNSSEHLILHRPQYDLALVIGFNYDHPVHYRGAGIFLHVNGQGATAGCVSAPRSFMVSTIQRLRGGAHPVIAIG